MLLELKIIEKLTRRRFSIFVETGSRHWNIV